MDIGCTAALYVDGVLCHYIELCILSPRDRDQSASDQWQWRPEPTLSTQFTVGQYTQPSIEEISSRSRYSIELKWLDPLHM